MESIYPRKFFDDEILRSGVSADEFYTQLISEKPSQEALQRRILRLSCDLRNTLKVSVYFYSNFILIF
jgi:hypothetical protein